MGILRYVLLLLLTTPSFSQEKKDPGEVQSDEKIPSQNTIDAILTRINDFRRFAGVPVVVEDKDLSQGCQLHAKYLQLNTSIADAATHNEEPDKPGFSELGKKAASRSVNCYRSKLNSPIQLVDHLVGMLYHRPPLIAPRLARVGVGYARFRNEGFVLVVDTSGKMRDPAESWQPLVFPGADQKEVPLSFGLGLSEWPDPLPEGSTKAGYPITVMVAPYAWQPSEADMRLFLGQTSIECSFSSPEKPAIKNWQQTGLYCLIPRDSLKPSSTYSVVFKCRQIGIEKTPIWTKTWSFTTVGK